MRLAWKTKYCPRGIQCEQRKEIDILKKLRHRHVIKLMGTYTQGPLLGLLLAPVAGSDLHTFMEDIDILHEGLSAGERCEIDDTQMMKRLDYLCPDTDGGSDLYNATVSRLSTCFGCLTGVIAYVHGQRIRHKDVKPSNILLSHKGLWLADFGISSDFSALSISQSEAVERGTPKYFAPEVALYDRSGRPADMFSLGCVFLELVALIRGIPLVELRKLRPEQNGSFQANLDHKASWFALLKSRNTRIQHVLCEVESMISTNPSSRPSASRLDRHLSIIAQFGGSRSVSLHGPCCDPQRFLDEIDHMSMEIEHLKLEILERDRYIDQLTCSDQPALPRPPLGENRPMMTQYNRLSESLEGNEVSYGR
jgi:serine/threonine protein kinase